MAQRNEDDIDSLENRVAELEMLQTITEKKLLKQGKAISELNGTVRYLQTVLLTITSPAFEINERDGGIAIFTNTGNNPDSAVFPHGPEINATDAGEAVTPAEVTPTRAMKRTREPCDSPTTKTAVHTDSILTESVTPTAPDDSATGGTGNRKRVRYERGDTFKLTFDETITQPPAPRSQ